MDGKEERRLLTEDTIDLQPSSSPSAKDHSRQPVRGAGSHGHTAPHQADALRVVENEINEQHGRSPRASQDLSGKELQMLHEDDGSHADVSESLLRNSAAHSQGTYQQQDEAESTSEDEGSLDDDMTDKISSSPSIGDDGETGARRERQLTA